MKITKKKNKYHKVLVTPAKADASWLISNPLLHVILSKAKNLLKQVGGEKGLKFQVSGIRFNSIGEQKPGSDKEL